MRVSFLWFLYRPPPPSVLLHHAWKGSTTVNPENYFLQEKHRCFAREARGDLFSEGDIIKKKKRFNDPAPLFSSKMGQRRRVVKKSPLFSFFLGPFGPPAFPHMLLWWLPLMEKQEREFVDKLFLSFSFIQFFSFTFHEPSKYIAHDGGVKYHPLRTPSSFLSWTLL